MGRKHAITILMLAAGAAVLFVAVEPRQGRATLQSELPERPEPAVDLGTLQGRDFDLRIEATQDGHRYTVVDHNGVVLDERLPLEMLRQKYPLLAPQDLWADEFGNDLGPLMVVPDDDF
jgi:hypothetical protein